MLDTLITSKTRLKLLLKFFLNKNTRAYLRSLEQEFGESSNAIRQELNKLEGAEFIASELQGNKKIYKANIHHPLYDNIHSLVKKHFGLEHLVEQVAERIGNLTAVYLTGDIAEGKDSKIIDLMFVGERIDREYLANLTQKAEKLIDRKIRYVLFSSEEFNKEKSNWNSSQILLLWKS